jgi:hypothetical protein
MATDSVKNVIITVKSNTKGIKDLQKEVDKLQKENEQMAKSFKTSNDKMNNQLKKTKGSMGDLGAVVGKVGTVIAGAFAFDQMVQFTKKVVETRAEFQKLEAVLTNTLGDASKAQQSLRMIQSFASNTPFAVKELTQSFVKLVNQGFKPTIKELEKLGDLASSTGKSFDQLTEAIIDAQTGEFERLKEFGIRASKEGDKVTFTFKGVQQQVDFTAKSIQGYILSLGELQGVSGAMSAISATLGGKISNLGDAWDTLLNTLGKGQQGLFADTIDFLIDATNWVTKMNMGFDDGFASAEKKIDDYLAKQTQATKEQIDNLDAFSTQIPILIFQLEQEYEKFGRKFEGFEFFNPDPDEKTTTSIKSLKEEIKLLTEKWESAEIGSKEATKAYDALIAKQRQLLIVTGKLNPELERQINALKALSKEVQKLAPIDVGTLPEMFVADPEMIIGAEIKKEFEMEELRLKGQEEIKERKIEIAQTTADTLFSITRNRLDAEFQYEKTINKAKLEQGLISQQQFEARQKRIAMEQAQSERQMATYEAILAGAVGVAKVWAQYSATPPVAFALSALTLAETGAQVAVINSAPLPQFEKGGLIGGKLHRDGGTVIEAERGEYVINRRRTAQHKEIIDEINNGDVMEYITKQYVFPALKQQRMDTAQTKSLADNIAKSITNHNAFNDQNIVGWLGRIDKTSKKNTNELVGALRTNRKDLRNV